MGLESIVNVVVSTQSAQVKQAGFGVPLIVDAHSRFTERIRFYEEADDLLDDGFTTDDAAYKAAVVLNSQSPSVAQFAVGRRANKPTMQFTIVPTVTNSKAYSVKINGVTKTFTSDGTATLSEIIVGLIAAIGAITGFTVAAVGGAGTETSFTITGNAAGNWLRVEALDASLLQVKQTHADPGLAADLAAIKLENDAWYGVAITTASAAEITALAAWVEANGRECVQATQDTDTITTAAAGGTDIMSAAKAAAYARTGLIYHPDNGAFADFAWMGAVLPKSPGSVTWKFKTLAGVSAVKLTPTQITNITDKSGNYYAEVGGIPITVEGWSAAGEFLDVVRDTDWDTSRRQTRLFSLLASNDKIPFTDHGIAVLAAEVGAQNVESVASGFLSNDPAPTVTVPLASSVASADRAIRKLRTIKYSGRIAGAVHSLDLNGTLTV
jgi:hypothetical protein